MRKIETAMNNAIDRLREKRANASWQQGNTTVVNHDMRDAGQATEIMLHGNHIATISESGSLHISLAGWDTPTTRGRISAIMRNRTAPYDHETNGENFSRRYPKGVGVSSRKTRHGQRISIHDIRGETPITVDGWHTVEL